MAYVTGIKVEKRLIELPPGTIVGTPYCVISPADCCITSSGNNSGDSPPGTCGCSDCPGGAAGQWYFVMSGISGGSTGTLENLNGTWFLNHDSGCQWSYTIGSVSWTLTKSGTTYVLTGRVTSGVTRTITYQLGHSTFYCCASNEFIYTGNNDGLTTYPTLINMIPVGSCDCTGGGGVNTDCCATEVPLTLTMTLTNKTGTCTCFADSITLTWDGTKWATTASSGHSCGGGSIDQTFLCDPGSGNFKLSATICGIISSTPLATSCDPFEVYYSGVSVLGCCSGTVDVTITG